MAVKIPYKKPILGSDLKPVLITKRDKHTNEIIWKSGPTSLPDGTTSGIPEQEAMDTYSMIASLADSIPSAIQTKNDDIQVLRVHTQLEASRHRSPDGGARPEPEISVEDYESAGEEAESTPPGDGFIAIKDGQWKWLLNLFNRTVPLAKDAPKDVVQRTVAQHAFGRHAYAIRMQLHGKDLVDTTPEEEAEPPTPEPEPEETAEEY